LYSLDANGHVVKATVQSSARSTPGPDGACGTKVANGTTVRLPLTTTLPKWAWVVRVNYFIGSDATLSVSSGASTQSSPIHRLDHTLDMVFVEPVDHFDVSVTDATAPLCITQVDVGFVPDAPSPRK
jgi:hypothetical protein